jgi:hypothetical protein
MDQGHTWRSVALADDLSYIADRLLPMAVLRCKAQQGTHPCERIQHMADRVHSETDTDNPPTGIDRVPRPTPPRTTLAGQP